MKKILRLEKFSTTHHDLEKLHSTTSKGAQPKWRHLPLELFIKQDYHGTESLTEWTVYNILANCTNIRAERIVPYYLCTVDGVPGCYSVDFKNDEDEITLADILDFQAKDINLIFGNKTPEERFKILKEILQVHTSKDFDYELKLMFAVDALFLNEDRHTSNISVLQDDNGEFRLSPIFDNGMALMSRLEAYPITIPLTRSIDKVKPVLLSSKFSKHVELYDYEPFLYKDKLEDFLEEYKEGLGRIYPLLKYQLKQKHIQKLLIKNNSTVMTSNIFIK